MIEEDVATPTNTTVVEDDASWIGRTIVTLVVLALLVAGAIWMVNAISDNDGDAPGIEQNDGTGGTGGDTQTDTDTDTDTTTDTTVPTTAP